MEGRGAVRSSARLCTTGAAAAPGEQRARPVEATAAAALRRARAAERAREVEDNPRVFREKCRRLARALRNAKHLVVYTGAGISTAADIPDYRGPRGVWTRLQRGETVGRVEVSRATPTFTHMALTALWARGALKFVVSQNCDGLHLRSGLPRRALAELHGDMFAEHCTSCRRVYLRAFDTTERTARHAHGTRRLCHGCGLELRDTIVHFGERGRAAWPLNWAGALRHAAAADVILCLGSSLKVLRRYPRLWCMHRAPQARPALYIVNLQWTPKDSVAALKINARCDAVMAEVARRLRLRVPRYKPRLDPLLAHAVPLAPPEAHTTRRPLLSAPNSESDADYPSSDPASPSASESDDELPLKRLADRLRGPPPPPDLLRAFQVNMQSGMATILLRTEHAPIQPPPEPPPPSDTPQRKQISDLRRFRMPQRPREPDSILKSTLNGCNQFAKTSSAYVEPSSVQIGMLKKEPKEEFDYSNGTWGVDSKLRQLLEYEPCIERKVESKDLVLKSECVEVKEEETSSSSDDSLCRSRARSLAAAIIRRAMLLCRASLYPGLHTIISPPSPATSPPRTRSPVSSAQCSWCARQFAARRCLWYRPAARALGARVWRRARGRRYLCACCGDEDGGAAAAAEAPEPIDDGGWYGKGYRKGRRKRR